MWDKLADLIGCAFGKFYKRDFVAIGQRRVNGERYGWEQEVPFETSLKVPKSLDATRLLRYVLLLLLQLVFNV